MSTPNNEMSKALDAAIASSNSAQENTPPLIISNSRQSSQSMTAQISPPGGLSLDPTPSNEQELLFKAVKENNVEQFLLYAKKLGMDINHKDANGLYPIHYAVLNKSKEVLENIIQIIYSTRNTDILKAKTNDDKYAIDLCLDTKYELGYKLLRAVAKHFFEAEYLKITETFITLNRGRTEASLPPLLPDPKTMQIGFDAEALMGERVTLQQASDSSDWRIKCNTFRPSDSSFSEPVSNEDLLRAIEGRKQKSSGKQAPAPQSPAERKQRSEQDQSSHKLCLYALNGNLEKFKELATRLGTAHMKSSKNTFPIHYAIQNKHMHIVRFIIDFDKKNLYEIIHSEAEIACKGSKQKQKFTPSVLARTLHGPDSEIFIFLNEMSFNAIETTIKLQQNNGGPSTLLNIEDPNNFMSFISTILGRKFHVDSSRPGLTVATATDDSLDNGNSLHHDFDSESEQGAQRSDHSESALNGNSSNHVENKDKKEKKRS